MSEMQKVQYRCKRIPPEGGYGFVVLLGVALPMGLVWGLFMCIGMIFDDFLTSIGEGTSAISLIMGVISIALSTSALFAGTLNEILSERATALLGAILFIAGSMATVFATSVIYLIVSYGIILGCGIGFMVPSAYATLNEYFVEKRVLIMSVAQTISGVVTSVFPIMVQFFMNKFGLRGTMAMIAAINTHALLGMLTLHPAKWHYKVIQIPYDDEEEEQRFIKSYVIDEKINEEEDRNESTDIENNKRDLPSEDLSKSLENEHHQVLSIRGRMSTVSVKQNGSMAVNKQDKFGKWQKVSDFLHLALLKDFVYVNISLGVTLAIFSGGFFYALQPMYLYELNISKDDTALLMAIGGGFDLGGRIFLSILSFFITIKARYIILTGAIMTVIFRCVFLNVFDFMALAIVSAILGFFRTFIILPTPIAFAEHLPMERFASGYGLFMFLQGIISFLMSPLIGWVRDTTQSYVICFHTLTLIMAVCAVLWLIEFAWFHLNGRKDNMPKTAARNNRPFN